jgi:hypothetical protein
MDTQGKKVDGKKVDAAGALGVVVRTLELLEVLL